MKQGKFGKHMALPEGSGKGGWSTQIPLKDETQHAVAIVGRVYYIHQRRSKVVCLPLNDVRCLAVHGLPALHHRNCLHSTLNVCMKDFGPSLNLFIKSLISPVKLILFFPE